ncbi:hypothetical protein FC97_GL001573 [Companilactobacillus kimchii DSM 13961 = JCM 10707]|uniref:Uncharacterized protein n=2 Tax=Companilactobacillus kimchii TaxID=2801452 RepID=A0ABR5NW20_9LACO|nr:hypothetical protein FC97_GL001573 [Companilactobacillus kimchii DSM 13961 = JCM 10707]
MEPMNEQVETNKVLNEVLNEVLGSAENENDFNLRFLYIQLMIASIKKNPKIKIYRAHQDAQEIFTLISSEIKKENEL